MKTNREFIKREILGETVLVPTGHASSVLNGMITLNDSASFLWSKIDQVKTAKQLVEEVRKEYDIDEETVWRDVYDFVEEFTKLGLLEVEG